MAGDVSFDVVSDFDEQELRNALDQVRREVEQRYDFKGAHSRPRRRPRTSSSCSTDDEFRAGAVKDLIESKAIRRNLSLKIFDWGKVEPAGGNKVRQRDRAAARPAARTSPSGSPSSSGTSSRRSSRRSRATPCASRARARTTCSGSSPGCASSTRPSRSSSRTTVRPRCRERASPRPTMRGRRDVIDARAGRCRQPTVAAGD